MCSRVSIQHLSSDPVEGTQVEESLREVEPGQATRKQCQLLRRDHSILEGQDGMGSSCSGAAGVWDSTTRNSS